MSAKVDALDGSRYDRQLILQATGTTDGSGNFYSPWLETADTLNIRIAGFFPGSGWAVTVQESPDAVDGHFVNTHAITTVSGNQFHGNCDLTARYFRVRVETTIENTYLLVVRAINTIGGPLV